jgi:hypothetical protein
MNVVELVPPLPAEEWPRSTSAPAARPTGRSAPPATPVSGRTEPHAWSSHQQLTEPGSDSAAHMACTVRPAPGREPSFDDEPRRHLHLIPAVVSPQLPFPHTPAAPSGPGPARRLTVVPDLPQPTVAVTDPVPSPASTSSVVSALPSAAWTPLAPGTPGRPDPSRFSRQFAQGVVEVLSGRRPMVQLARHVSPAVQRGLTRAGGSQPLKSPTAPTLHSLHLSEPAAGVCELSAIVVVGVRYRALAARLEWKIDHWRCTALQIG